MPDTEPLWLTRLRDALLAPDVLPAIDEAFVHAGTRYLCHRALTYSADNRLLFRELWLDPATYRLQQSWTQELEAGAFVGDIPEGVWRQTVAQVVRWLNQARPQGYTRERPAAWLPHRFAHSPRTPR